MPKGKQRGKPVLRASISAVNQFIDIHKNVGKIGFQCVSFTELVAPVEIPGALLARHFGINRPVAGKGDKLGFFRAVVGKTFGFNGKESEFSIFRAHIGRMGKG